MSICNCLKSHRRWMVTISTCFVFAGVLAPMTVYGRLFIDIGSEIGTSAVQTGWIASVTWAMCHLAGPLPERMETYIGYRPVVIIGVSLTALSIFTSSYMNSFPGLLLFYGFGYGTSVNLVLHAATCVLFKYFRDSKSTLATGIAFSGSSAGTILLTVVYEKMVPLIGWRVMLRLTSLYCVIISIPCFFLTFKTDEGRKVSKDKRSMKRILQGNNKKITENSPDTSEAHFEELRPGHCIASDDVIQDEPVTNKANSTTWKKLLTDTLTWLFFFAVFLPAMAWSVFWINIVSFFESVNIKDLCILKLLTVQAVFELVGKLGVGFLAQLVPVIYVLICHNLLFLFVCIVLVFFPTYEVLLVASILIGTGRGTYNILPYSVATYVLPDDSSDKAVTIAMIALGLGFTFGTLPAGAIFDATGSYTYAFLVNTAWYAMGFVLLLFSTQVLYKKQTIVQTSQSHQPTLSHSV
ncbi:Monocarboxylate transporter 14 [Holothuria leucospilota]|uniref:Monocarboxylate transporter 14 n=1 Tax=Holothuria leucospilota TaxID=206669 RepID=A0A9Q1H630_HOLLE|nr:Monocarboxylate transporter 14 [Holothuria leucospilota]